MAVKRVVAKKAKEEVKVQNEQVLQETPTTELVTFKKIGGGSLRFGNHIIKPGQVFTATWDEIPKAFHKSLQVMQGSTEARAIHLIQAPPKKKFKIEVISEEEGTYNIVSIGKGKVLNEAPLSKEEAETILAGL